MNISKTAIQGIICGMEINEYIENRMYFRSVYNQKSSVAGELKIHRLSRVSGSCQGGDEVILLCDRVRKEDIRVKFFEVDEHYNEVWTDQGTFNLADVHYQVAITFKTPPYQSNVEKDVKIQLYRITDGAVSEPRDFKYLPDEEDFASVAKKRKKPNPSHNFPASTQISVAGNMIDKKYEHLSSDGNAEAPSALSANSLIEPGNEAMQESYSMRQSGEDIGLHSQNEEDLNKNVTELLAEFLPKLSEDLVDNDVTFFDPTYFDDLNIDNTDSNLHIDGAVAKVASLSLNDNSRKVVNWKPESTHKCLRELIACILQTGDVNSLLLSVQNIIPLQDDHGNSLLHIAVSSQNVNLKIIQHLLNVISEDVVNLKNKCKETALHLAVKLNKEKVLKLLLQKGGDPNIPNQDGNNCLHIAAKSDFVLCMKELLHATKCSYFHALNAHNYEGKYIYIL
ncbi:nuclear factor NF-kappa-B p105 subunit-like [Stegodyphus dumicola]|uniref:nuclear factor NF-kappa-B p105 subunit-like n=1 Tax=Stegodyphus dumicola TaxID=202533 RepID=UPI0015A9FED8|nr:nuclear factor NF-kappa-B p105 subunit-like [Stegodyphus dumicola]